jgi:hypothetical protein
MAWTVQTIDALARLLGRDVIYLSFSDELWEKDVDAEIQKITDWLDERKIEWKVVENFDPDTVWVEGGPSCLFIDIDPEQPDFAVITDKFVAPDGSAAEPGFALDRLPVATALQHAERDDEAFWDRYV